MVLVYNSPAEHEPVFDLSAILTCPPSVLKVAEAKAELKLKLKAYMQLHGLSFSRKSQDINDHQNFLTGFGVTYLNEFERFSVRHLTFCPDKD